MSPRKVQQRYGPKPKRNDNCRHKQCLPAFDSVAAQGLPEGEVRRRWPRYDGNCPTCGQAVIIYASAAHYIAGDW